MVGLIRVSGAVAVALVALLVAIAGFLLVNHAASPASALAAASDASQSEVGSAIRTRPGGKDKGKGKGKGRDRGRPPREAKIPKTGKFKVTKEGTSITGGSVQVKRQGKKKKAKKKRIVSKLTVKVGAPYRASCGGSTIKVNKKKLKVKKVGRAFGFGKKKNGALVPKNVKLKIGKKTVKGKLRLSFGVSGGSISGQIEAKGDCVVPFTANR